MNQKSSVVQILKSVPQVLKSDTKGDFQSFHPVILVFLVSS